MKCSTINIGVVLALGLVLTLALLWLLDGWPTLVTAASTGRPLSDATPTHYVVPGGTDSGDCSAPASACRTIQYAVDRAGEGDEIRVAAGTYTDLNIAIVDWNIITQVVYIRKSITVQGGYTTTDWGVPDPVANPTVLDARGQGRVLYISGAISPTIKGLCITGGNAAGLGGGSLEEDAGGGVYVIANMTAISNNRVFSNAADYGGGLYLDYGAATLSGNAVTSNTAGYGGGLFLSNSAATLSGNAVTANTADYGGGLFLDKSAAMLSGNTVASNAANFFGGGLLLLHSDGAALDGNVVIANTAGYGGGLYLNKSAATLTNNVVAGNRANTAGSGLYVLASSPRLLHTTIVHNGSAGLTAGSGVYVTNDGPHRSTVALTNTILVSHTVGITITAGNTVTLEATLWGADTWANMTDSGGAGTTIIGTCNYQGDPGFVDPGVRSYRIGPRSAAIDKGIDAGIYDDMDGQTRPHYGGYDLGADEWWPLIAFKAVTPDTSEPGEVVTYTLTLTNATGAAMTVRLTDTLPTQIGYIGPLVCSNGDGGHASGIITWTGVVYTTTPTLVAWAAQIAPDVPYSTTITNTTVVSDAYGLFQITPAILVVPSRYVFLPLVLRDH